MSGIHDIQYLCLVSLIHIIYIWYPLYRIFYACYLDHVSDFMYSVCIALNFSLSN